MPERPTNATIVQTRTAAPQPKTIASLYQPVGDPCVIVIFGASGDLTKRLLMPALYNLACESLLPEQFVVVGADIVEMTSEQFRAKMGDENDGIKKFHTRKKFDQSVWDNLVARFHYVQAKDLGGYATLKNLVKQLQAEHKIADNVLFYFAVSPKIFGLISGNLAKSGFAEASGGGWRRLIVEKPFGTDLKSAKELNQQLLSYWREDQIYRIDHYLGKETVQNLLAFRFSNGIFEPLWNNNYVDHIQLNVSEMVAVEGRADYYDKSGVLRDMIQNHMFQMMAYLMMEPPCSFKADAIRNEKSKLLDSVRVYSPQDAFRNTVRGQYGAGKKPDGTPLSDYRHAQGVGPDSGTPTYAAIKLMIDNWRWEGVPVYLRSGKALWKRGTEIVVEFKKAPEVLFRGTAAADRVEPNRLIFHIQPDQGIELRFHAKSPGPSMFLQNVNMRFNYHESFEASRATGYEVMLYTCMLGDATLFSRSDLVETAWRIAQPMLDAWEASAPTDYPNYPAGSWGPVAAYDLIERDGRKWIEVINRSVLERVPLFKGGNDTLMHMLTLALSPTAAAPGENIVRKGEVGQEMYFISRGSVDVLDGDDKVIKKLGEGDFFGELALLSNQPRSATVRATTPCDMFVLERGDFTRALKEYPQFAESIQEVARARYQVTTTAPE
jgi:glucose-6-phosphate 1-dehydrogenase